MQTTTDSLRPYTVLELLDRAFHIYRENFVAFIGLTALVTIPATLISFLTSNWFTGQLVRSNYTASSLSRASNAEAFSAIGSMLSAYGVLIVMEVVIGIIYGVLVNGPLVYMTSENHLGRRVTLGEAWRAVQGSLPRLTAALTLSYVIVGVIAIGLAFAVFLCGLGFGLVAYIWIALFAFLTPVMILEPTGVSTGLRRAWILGKTRIWPVVGLTLAIIVIDYIFNLGMNVAARLLVPTTIGTASSATSQLVLTVLNAIIGACIAPIWPVALTLLYYDTRVRVEGLDIALRTVNVPDPRPRDVISPPPPSDWLLASKDLVNLGIFSVGTLIVMIGLVVLFAGALTTLLGVSGF